MSSTKAYAECAQQAADTHGVDAAAFRTLAAQLLPSRAAGIPYTVEELDVAAREALANLDGVAAVSAALVSK